MTPDERAAFLERPPPGAPDVEAAHAAAAAAGDTAPPAPDAEVDLHFVALVHAGGRLVELDGRKRCAVDHGPTTKDDLLNDAARVAREFMARSAESVQFNMMALAGVVE
jgi:ubiquitin carboxyl-terminal hydrolase L3